MFARQFAVVGMGELDLSGSKSYKRHCTFIELHGIIRHGVLDLSYGQSWAKYLAKVQRSSANGPYGHVQGHHTLDANF